MEAALNTLAKGVVVLPEIMVPLVGTVEEFVHQSALIRRVAAAVFAERGDTVPYSVGTMIEVPRAALLAEDIAKVSPWPLLLRLHIFCLSSSSHDTVITPFPQPQPQLKLHQPHFSSHIHPLSNQHSLVGPILHSLRYRTSSPSALTT